VEEGFTVVDCNRRILEILGRTREEIVGRTPVDLSPPYQPDGRKSEEKGRDMWEALLQEGQPPAFEWVHTRGDGTQRYVEVGLTLVEMNGRRHGMGILRDITERKRTEEALRQSHLRLQALSRRLVQAQEEERGRIARDLHDETGQALTALKINLQALQRLPGAEVVAEHLDDSIDIAERTLQHVRDISLDLRPSLLDDLGLVSALRWYTDRLAQRAGFAVKMHTDSDETGLDPAVETACFRIVQEALTNVMRHAQARQVTVGMRQAEDELRLSIHDDGAGFDVNAAMGRATGGASLGLLSMQERAYLAGGRVEIDSAPGQGTEIRVHFPLAPTPEGSRGMEDSP